MATVDTKRPRKNNLTDNEARARRIMNDAISN